MASAAAQCMRQFAGISMLVKQRCFACGKPGAPRTACDTACFCPGGCEESDVGKAHRKLGKRVRASNVTVETEVVQLI